MARVMREMEDTWRPLCFQSSDDAQIEMEATEADCHDCSACPWLNECYAMREG